MSQAEALLNSLTQTVINHKHEVPDSDTHFLIDPYTRQIENTNYQKTVLMRGDHNSERFTFEIPRYVDGHDMSLCNRVIVHFDNVGDSIENIYSDVAYMDDLRINPDKPDTVISSWLIRREATQIVGILSFSLQYQCVEEEEITYEWNTDSYDDIEIRKSKQNGEAAIIQYTNVLEQWRSQIFGAGDSVMANISAEGATQVTAVQSESATQQAAIELKGSETLASIPDDYTEVYNMASEAVRTKADGVVCETEGEFITISDASDDYIRGLNVYGKSTQFTTTGKNLFDSNPDNIVLIDKTEAPHYGYSIELPAGTYTISATAYIDTYLYAAIYDGNAVSENSYIVLPTETRSATVTINDGDILYLYNAITHTSTPGNRESTMSAFEACPIQIENGESATEYEPYTGGIPSPNPEYPQEIVNVENPIVRVASKNLITETDIEFTQDYYMDLGMPYPPGKYSFSAVVNSTDTDSDQSVVMFYVDGVDTVRSVFIKRSTSNDDRITFTTNIYKPFDSLRFYASTGWSPSSGDTATFKDIMLEYMTSDFELEDPNNQTMALEYTLPGIPVKSGGNYIDNDGRRWICDEVDLERGVYIQRIIRKTFSGSSDEIWRSYKVSESGTHTAYQESKLSADIKVFTGLSENKSWLLSDKYVAVPLGEMYSSGHQGVAVSNVNPVIRICVDACTGYSADEFKTWLAENPFDLVYPLATPIETPLTAEEIETYKSLKTNYPNTTIINDSNAWMKVKYNADTKLYISNTVETGVVNVVEGVLNDTY